MLPPALAETTTPALMDIDSERPPTTETSRRDRDAVPARAFTIGLA
jgi:hypothetical protein